jgi:imidazolonepropionase-like amidohydrolase
MDCVHGKTVYTGATVTKDAYVLFDGQRIVGLAAARKGELKGEFDVITPAFIDAHCHIGMERSGEPSSEGEANEQMDTIVALADALDSVMLDDAAFKESVEAGVLYSCVVPGSGNIVGGRSAVIRNYGRTTTEALVARAGLKAALGFNTAVATRNWKGTRPFTRMGALSLLRKRLDEVRQKMEKLRKAKGKARAEITFSAEDSVLRALLEGKDRLRVHAHKVDDIACLLRLTDEFELKVTVEHTCDVSSPHIYEELRRRGIAVVFGPVDSFAYKVELRHESWRNIRHLLDSGVEFGLMTDHPVMLQRDLHLQLRHFLRLGLSRAEAIAIITRKNAEILGVSRSLGTLEKGKWASFIGWNGDPFDLAKHPVAVYGEGRRLYAES